MEPDPSLSSSLLYSLPYGSWRKRYILFRYSLDRSPTLLFVFELTLGILVHLHPALSFSILTLSSNYDRFELSIIPLICLCIEILILTSLTLVVFLSETPLRAVYSTTWHRKYLFLVAKLMFFCIMVLVSLCLCVYYIETKEKNIVFHSIFTMTLPITILNVCSICKILLINTENTKFLVLIHCLVMSSIVLLILRIDFDVFIPWAVICMNPGIAFVMFLAKSVVECLEMIKNKENLRAGFCGCCLLGCISGVLCMFFVERFLIFSIPAIFMFKLTGWLTICLLGVGYSIKTGEFLIEITFGHVENDFLNIKKPMACPAGLLNRCKSI